MIPNFTHTITLTSDSFMNDIEASGDAYSFVIFTVIKVTAGGYTGLGYVWGVGLGGVQFSGTLMYDSWEELTSAENSI
jgi:hypothetical protein